MNLEYFYSRYNEFVDLGYPIQDAQTVFRIMKEGALTKDIAEQKIIKYEISDRAESMLKRGELTFDNKTSQPKSMLWHMQYLNLILNALPQSYFEQFGISASKIQNITMAIALYYFSLQTYKFGPKEISDTQKRNLIGSEDFYITCNDLKKVSGEIQDDEFAKYVGLFSKDVDDIEPEDEVKLYVYKGKAFILCIEEFVEYIQYKIESIFKEAYPQEEYSRYTKEKGSAFEKLVYNTLQVSFDEIYHTLFYNPNSKQKCELDVIARENDDLLIVECKSGTLNMCHAQNDETIKLLLKNKTRDAHKTLRTVENYLKSSSTYVFENGKEKIIGNTADYFLLNVPMYSADYISSNLHTIFPEYDEDVETPILTISLEHLFAIIIDLIRRGETLLGYLRKRIDYRKKYPTLRFENNELDLYYEIMNPDSLLAEIRNNGMLDSLKKNGRVIGTYHDAFGNDTRPAVNLLRGLDIFLMENLFRTGKSYFRIQRGLMLRDSILSAVNAREEHTVHPHGYF